MQPNLIWDIQILASKECLILQGSAFVICQCKQTAEVAITNTDSGENIALNHNSRIDRLYVTQFRLHIRGELALPPSLPWIWNWIEIWLDLYKLAMKGLRYSISSQLIDFWPKTEEFFHRWVINFFQLNILKIYTKAQSTILEFTRIAVNCKFHSQFWNFKLT